MTANKNLIFDYNKLVVTNVLIMEIMAIPREPTFKDLQVSQNCLKDN
jgi:hypothetical protein